MTSNESVKLPPIFDKTITKQNKTGYFPESESSSSPTSSRRFKSFKKMVNVVGKTSKWTKETNKEIKEDQSKKVSAKEKRLTFNVSGVYIPMCFSNLRFKGACIFITVSLLRSTIR